MPEDRVRTAVLSLKTLAAASVILPMLVFTVIVEGYYARVTANAPETAREEVKLLAQHAAQVFATVEAIRTRVNDRIRTMSRGGAQREKLHDVLASIQGDHPTAEAILLVEGASTRVPPTLAEPGLGDFAWSDGGQPTLIIGGEDGAAFDVATARELAGNTGSSGSGPEGSSIVLLISPRYFTDVWGGFAPRASEITLLSSDGAILARNPPSSPQRVVLPPGSVLLQAIHDGDQGTVRARSDLDGVDRIYAFNKIPGYALVIAYGVSVETLFEPWRVLLPTYSLLGVVIALTIFGLGMLVRRRVHDEQMLWHCAITRESEERAIAEREFQQAQKMEVVGQLAGGMAHDFGNVLAGVAMQLSALRHHGSDPRKCESAVIAALAGIDRGAKVVRSLLNLARRHRAKSEAFDVHERLRALESLLCECVTPLSQVVFDFEPELWSIDGDANCFELAMLNLALNARDAMPTGGTLRIATSRVRLAGEPAGLAGDFIRVEVEDTGTGMRPEILARAAEPFFTTKAVSEGTGLGLSQVFHFARQSAGAATIASEPGRGTAVSIYLPRSQNSGAATHLDRRIARFDVQLAS